jgi:hypothetical protein
VAEALSADRPRIFCIGLNKTATTSFHEAMELLGFKSLHWGGPSVRQAVEAALAEGRPALADLDPTFDAFSDVEPLYRHFDVVDRQYPGSRFVLTVRPVDDWVASRRRHVERNVARKAAGEYHGHFLEVDEPAWRAEWHDHVHRVRAHFQGRPEFVEVDLTTSPGWGPLCSLLGVAPPDRPFPWANRDPDVADGRGAPPTAERG